MSENGYLSEEEQYKDIIDNQAISRIKDSELRNIRFKYWQLIHKIFLDEHNISDEEYFMKKHKLKLQELAEITAYKERKKC